MKSGTNGSEVKCSDERKEQIDIHEALKTDVSKRSGKMKTVRHNVKNLLRDLIK